MSVTSLSCTAAPAPTVDASASGHHPLCPRCGYDLRGLASATVHIRPPRARPSDGTCSECGLAFSWSQVLSPAGRQLSWLFEHAPRRRPALLRAVQTLAVTLQPWRFWREVSIHIPVRPARLLLWLPVLIVPLHLLWGASLFVMRVQWLRSAFFGKLPPLAGTEWETFLLNAWLYPYLAIGGSRSTSLRVVVMTPDASTLIPLGVTLAVPTTLLLLTRTRAAAKVRPEHILRAAVYGAGWVVGWYALWTIRTAARAIEAVAPAIALPELPTRVNLPRISGIFPGASFSALVLLAAAFVLWLGFWWWFALARGLAMPRPRRIWALVMLIGLLAGITAGVLDPRFRAWLAAL